MPIRTIDAAPPPPTPPTYPPVPGKQVAPPLQALADAARKGDGRAAMGARQYLRKCGYELIHVGELKALRHAATGRPDDSTGDLDG